MPAESSGGWGRDSIARPAPRRTPTVLAPTSRAQARSIHQANFPRHAPGRSRGHQAAMTARGQILGARGPGAARSARTRRDLAGPQRSRRDGSPAVEARVARLFVTYHCRGSTAVPRPNRSADIRPMQNGGRDPLLPPRNRNAANADRNLGGFLTTHITKISCRRAAVRPHRRGPAWTSSKDDGSDYAKNTLSPSSIPLSRTRGAQIRSATSKWFPQRRIPDRDRRMLNRGCR